MGRKKGIRTALVLLVVSMALVAMVATPASAGPRLNCVMTGNAVTTDDGAGGWDWTVGGAGPCLNFLSGPYFATLAGSGHSDSLGLCDGLIVQNLEIDVTLNILNIRTGVVSVVTETWGSPITTYPIATPFLISGGQSGLGAIATRILGQCPPGGAAVATFAFSTST